MVHSFLEHSFKIIKKWGFEYKIPIVWRKLTENKKVFFGSGNYFRSSLEICLFCTKNNYKLNTRNTRNIFDAINPKEESRKPKKLYNIIEKNSNPPYIELFATQKRIGWDSVGFKLSRKDIREEIYEYINKNESEYEFNKIYSKKSLRGWINAKTN